MNTIDQAMQVLQAMMEGETIQIMLYGEWKDRAFGQKDKIPKFLEFDYRVKPKPRVFWANVYADKPEAYYMYKNKAEALSFCHLDGETIELMEVIK